MLDALLDPIFEWLFRHPPLGPVVFFGLIGLGVFATFKGVFMLVSDVKTHRDQVATATREREQLLEQIDRIHGEVCLELVELTALARRQIAGEKIQNEGVHVRVAFRRIEKLIERHERDELRTWLKAVTDAYRYRVRLIVQDADAGAISPEIATELLDDLHHQSVTDLKPKLRKDGQVLSKIPRDSEGNPFDLSKIDHGTEGAG